MVKGGSSSGGGGGWGKIQVQTRIRKLSADLKRPSELVRLKDADFAERFQFLWDEHVEGFTGLRGKRRERTEKELNMEWRVRLRRKREEDAKARSNIPKARQKPETKARAPVRAKPKKGSGTQEAARLAAIAKYRELKNKLKAKKK